MYKYNINLFIILLGVLSIDVGLASTIETNSNDVRYQLTDDNYLSNWRAQDNIEVFEKSNDGVVMFLVQFAIPRGETIQRHILTDNECYQDLRSMGGLTRESVFKGTIDIYMDDKKIQTINRKDFQEETPVLGRAISDQIDGYIFLIYKDDMKKISITPHLVAKNQDHSQNRIYLCAKMIEVFLGVRNGKIPPLIVEYLHPNIPWINLYEHSKTYPLKGAVPKFIKEGKKLI